MQLVSLPLLVTRAINLILHSIAILLMYAFSPKKCAYYVQNYSSIIIIIYQLLFDRVVLLELCLP